MDGADSAQSPAGSQGQANRTEAYLELPPPRTRPELAAFIARAAIDGARNRRTFRGVERFFFMLGYTRSGSTLVGSLLNAHPEMVIAQEIDIFRFLRPGITRNTLYGMVLVRDRQFAAIDRDYHGFDYAVPEGDQGRFTRLRVLGDKHAGRATRRLHATTRRRSNACVHWSAFRSGSSTWCATRSTTLPPSLETARCPFRRRLPFTASWASRSTR